MVANLPKPVEERGIAGRTVYIPQMSYAGARMMAAAFRACGIDAAPTPDSTDETLDLGSLHSGGEECLPHKITLGDFLRITRQPDFEAGKTAFFMPRAPGPCRFGQYATVLRKVLDEQGLEDVVVFSPNSDDNYGDLGDHASHMMRFAWMGIVTGDLATRFLLKTRPYARNGAEADAAFHDSIDDLGEVLAMPGQTPGQKIDALKASVARMRERFLDVPADYVKGRPLIGLVGEIYCRQNTFSNEDTARRIEQLGGECWLSDLSEWVWYTNWSRETDWNRDHGWLNLGYLKLKLKNLVQHRYEHALLEPVHADFVGYEEPRIDEVVELSQPYLPATGALGEMTLSAGKAIYLHKKGVDGIIDISPFTCMNGIVSEAVYPAISEDYDNIPIRSVYFDKTSTNVDRDLEIFLDLARAYQKRKPHARRYPHYFV